MSMTYCKRCEQRFDTDAAEHVLLCGFCLRQRITETVPATIPLCIGDWPISELDCDFVLAWDHDMQRWELEAILVQAFDKREIRIERDGTVKLHNHFRLHATLAKAIANQATCELEAHRAVLTADLPDHSDPEMVPYTDDAYRRIAQAH